MDISIAFENAMFISNMVDSAERTCHHADSFKHIYKKTYLGFNFSYNFMHTLIK